MYTFKEYRQNLEEALNKPLPWKWTKKNKLATFKVQDSTVEVGIDTNSLGAGVAFAIDGNSDKDMFSDTNKSSNLSKDVFKIFATVLAILREWYKNKGKDVDLINFTAHGASKIKLYDRMVNSFAKEFGLNVNKHNLGSAGALFGLTKE